MRPISTGYQENPKNKLTPSTNKNEYLTTQSVSYPHNILLYKSKCLSIF